MGGLAAVTICITLLIITRRRNNRKSEPIYDVTNGVPSENGLVTAAPTIGTVQNQGFVTPFLDATLSSTSIRFPYSSFNHAHVPNNLLRDFHTKQSTKRSHFVNSWPLWVGIIEHIFALRGFCEHRAGRLFTSGFYSPIPACQYGFSQHCSTSW